MLSVQASHRLGPGGRDLTGALSYQANTTNDLGYSYGDDAIVSLSLARPIAPRLRASLQLKWTHRGRSSFQGEGVESTGGSVVYAIPGLVTTLSARLSLYFFLPVPVYRYVNETRVALRLSLVLGMPRSF